MAHAELGKLILERVQGSGSSASSPEIDRARDHFRKAFELNPNLPEALLGQGYIANLRGDRSEMESLSRTLREMLGTP